LKDIRRKKRKRGVEKDVIVVALFPRFGPLIAPLWFAGWTSKKLIQTQPTSVIELGHDALTHLPFLYPHSGSKRGDDNS